MPRGPDGSIPAPSDRSEGDPPTMAITDIAGIIRHWSVETPDRPAISCNGKTSTWAEHAERCRRVANALVAGGAGSQDRIAFIDKNGPEYFEVLFGGALTNVVNVAVNWRLAPPEMAYIINDAEAKILFVGNDFLDHLAQIEDQLVTVTTIVVLGPTGAHPKHEAYEDWIARSEAVDPGIHSGMGDVAMQLYTSGTTGLPKGVMLSNENLFTLIPEGSAEMEIGPDSVSMVAMPLFHIGGSGWALLGYSNGSHTVVIREVDPDVILSSFPQYGVTHAFIVPAAIMLLLSVPQCTTTDFSAFKYMAYGASPISVATLVKAMEVFGCKFIQLYGLTETTGGITRLLPEDHDPVNRPDLLRSCGRPFPSVELRIISAETDGDAADGGVGEVWVRTPQNMLGYWKRPDETAKTITVDGWLKSGDAGYLVDGYLYLHDRVKDMIVSGGENIYPAEVENALMAHPAVADCAVIGVPSDKWGETVKAIVVRADNADDADDALASSLIEHCRTLLARYKCPTSVDFVEALPRNPSGKILKRELREPFWAGIERRIN